MQAMDVAINMKPDERKERLSIAYSYIEEQSTLKWALGFLRDLKRVQLNNEKAKLHTKIQFLGYNLTARLVASEKCFVEIDLDKATHNF